MNTKDNELTEIIYSDNMPPIAKRKALAVSMKNAGIGTTQIGKVVGVSGRRVCDYVKKYEEDGIVSIITVNRYRPSSCLEDYKEQIAEAFKENPPSTANEASERIQELTGIKRSPTQVRTFMHRLGMKPRKVGHIPAKADPDKQEEFLETELEPRLKDAAEGKRAVLFVDASHFIWQVYLGILWCFTRVFIQASSGRQRINVLGAYDPIKNELLKIINRTYITSATICELLEIIRKKYGEQMITIVLDNARYQHCMLVMETAASLNIELLFLPTYSPNLNLIERLWRFVKKECLYSKYYKTSNEFEEAIEKCLDEIDKSKKERVKSLMTLNFQLFDRPEKAA